MSNFKHLAEQFPSNQVNLEVIILIGRDNMWLFRDVEYEKPRGIDTIAAKTPIGWALIGPKPESKKLETHKVLFTRSTDGQEEESVIEHVARTNWSPCTWPYNLEEKEITRKTFLTTHEDEDLSYSGDERKYLKDVIPRICSNPHGYIQLPIAFCDFS